MDEKRNHIVQVALKLLTESIPQGNEQKWSWETVAPDGSCRILLRFTNDAKSYIAVAPGEPDTQGLAEAQSVWHIGAHLYGRGIPVAEPLAYDARIGLVLLEDLGKIRLHDLVTNTPVRKNDARFDLYCRAVRALAAMQVRGGEDFQPSWCWDSEKYDRELMLTRESDYFLQSFCKDLMKMTPDEEKLHKDFLHLAGQAAEAPSHYFLHRDFQCRNIMVHRNDVHFVDFQGGRLGPLAYDLASLLRDPYAGLEQDVQDDLLAVYLDSLLLLTDYDPERLYREYFFLALQRNLQILGAFAFLSKRRGKQFFSQFISPALSSLVQLLAKPEGARYAYLRTIAEESLQKLLQHEFTNPLIR